MWLLVAAAGLIADWQVLGQLIDHHNPALIWIAAAHFFIIVSVLLLLLFSFGRHNVLTIFQTYKKELLYCIAMAIAFFGFLYLVYSLWTVLAVVVLKSVRALLNLVGVQSIFFAPRTLLFSKFAINIAEFCSGIESIALFTALYVLFGVLDWRRFNHKKYLAAFPPALLILFGFNILRVFILILGGYYISPQIAFSLFHTYAGMVFFIIYSGVFWSISYRWMLHERIRGKALS
jgi:exosortase/archaeosortase family protein